MAKKQAYQCTVGIGFGSCYPRRDTVERYVVYSVSERGARMAAKKRYNAEFLEPRGMRNADYYGWCCEVTEL